MDKFLLSFTFKSSKLEGRGPGFLLGTLLFCLGELAADVGVLLFKVFSGEFPLLLCLSFSGLQVIGKRGTRMSILNILSFQSRGCDSESHVFEANEQINFFYKSMLNLTHYC